MTETSKPPIDRAHMSPALVGFYVSCALVSAGAALFFFAWFVLTRPDYGSVPTVLKVFGAGGMLFGVPGAFLCLRRARGPAS